MAILGINSVESSHARDDGLTSLLDNNVAAGHDGDDEGHCPIEFFEFNNGNEDKEDEEFAAANSQRSVVHDVGHP